MIPRYETEVMREVWAEELKFGLWLELELAVLEVRAEAGELPMEQFERIKSKARFSIERINEIEAEIGHDLLAFVQAVQENLDPKDRSEFHRKMTSYDSEEIPLVMRIQTAIDRLRCGGGEAGGLYELHKALMARAKQHRRTLMIGRTHCQHAEPVTFGFVLAGWADIFSRNDEELDHLCNGVMNVGKLSGAVGVYGDLSPAVEKSVCNTFNVKPARHSTQILHRDRHARVMNELAILASNIEHVATDLRLMSQTEVGEIREPFGKKQKGSSRMPHKKNPITLERLCGMARIVRGNALAMMESISTWSARDISQSSVERIVLADSFHLVHYMLKKLTWIIAEMEVFPRRMLENIALTKDCVYSGRVKDLLLGWGMEPEQAYRLVQQLSFSAMSGTSPLRGLVACNSEIEQLVNAGDRTERQKQLTACFDPWQGLSHLDEIYTRFGIDEEEIKKEEEVITEP